MKKIIFITISAIATLLASCNMDLSPYSQIEESKGMATFEDAQNYRISFYSSLMGLVGGARWTVEEIRGDMFHAMADFGNTYGDFYTWRMQSTDQTADALWYSDYGLVGIANYAIDRFNKILNNGDLTSEEEGLLELYIAEAHLTRALAYLDLVTKFCEAYDPDNAENQMGLPLQTDYNPTTSASKYPGRSSLEDTYNLILDDLAEAANITTNGVANSYYYTEDVVEALYARVYLYMENWEDAMSASDGLIKSSKYSLVESQSTHDAMWLNDNSTENIMLIAMDLNNLGNATGINYLNDRKNNGVMDPEFIPTQTLLDLYDKGDVRFKTYFKEYNITAVGYGTDNLYLFNKFPGNPDLYRLSPNYVNKGKPFRLAEQYLIYAECCAQLGEVKDGVDCLNKLRKARNPENYVALSTGMSADDLLQNVQAERVRELVGEGFRMHDLKRWELGVTRGRPQNASMVKAGADYAELSRTIEDNHYLWPIPKKEIDANPQIKDQKQQNPGY